MIKMTAVIIDDEQDSIDVLCELTKDHPDVEIMGSATNADEGIKLLKRIKPQILFLDIEMPQSDGFSVLKEFVNPCFKVIFVTGYNQYAIKAIRFSAIDYILKPVDQTELYHAIERVQLSLKESIDPRIQQFVHLGSEVEALDRIVIYSKAGFNVLVLKEIISIWSLSGNYSVFHMTNKKKRVATRPLIHYEDLLSREGFFRVHRSFIVNLHHVRGYDAYTRQITLSTDERLKVSFRRRKSFQAFFKDHLSQQSTLRE